MENLQIKLTLTLAEVQTILAKLGPHAYAEVGLLIPKIQQQAQVQVDEAIAPFAEKPDAVASEFAEFKARSRNGVVDPDMPYGIRLHFEPPAA